MGKIGICGILALCAALTCTTALARKPKLATVLPSQVKTIHLKPSRHVSMPKAKVRAASVPKEETDGMPAGARWFSPELRAEALKNQNSFKYFKSAVQYFRSDYQLPESYNCDSDTVDQQRSQAESQALAECEADGANDCRLVKSLIARNGVLRCSDFPQGQCPARGHFRGCRGEALVIGEKPIVHEARN